MNDVRPFGDPGRRRGTIGTRGTGPGGGGLGDPRSMSVRVRAPGKINLSLRSGPLDEDGYHPLATVFQALALSEEVIASEPGFGDLAADQDPSSEAGLEWSSAAGGIRIAVRGTGADRVPRDPSNLAVRAALVLADHVGLEPLVDLELVKGVPVAGGMGGGSADAAAALVACDALWGTGLSRDELAVLAAEIGADVPFALYGHTAIGSGRGDLISPVMVRGAYHWVLALQHEGLSTPSVYRRFDELVPDPPRLDPASDRALIQALRAGDAEALGQALHNDLQVAALDLAPHLAAPIEVAVAAGAVGALVSGSGPTVAALARDPHHALLIATELTLAGVADEVVTTRGPAQGARVVQSMARD